MYKADIQPEQKPAVVTEALRNQEKQRQSRIFNVQNPVIGVDAAALKNQVQEPKRREVAEQAQEADFDANQIQCDLVTQLLEKEGLQRARQVAQRVQAFREWVQQPWNCQDFDLYEPANLQKEKAPHSSNVDCYRGPSSMQFFAGEDLAHATRQHLKQEQAHHELSHQQEEHRQEILGGQKQIEMDLQATRLEDLDVTMADYNRAQAREVGERQRLAQKREQDDNLTEIHNHLTSDMLTENPSVSSNPLVPLRVTLGSWKGMSPEKIAAIQKKRAGQRLKAKHRRQTERHLQKQLADQTACQPEHKQQVQAQKIQGDLDVYKQLAQQQQAQKDYLDKVVYTNEPTDYFHFHFNTSS